MRVLPLAALIGVVFTLALAMPASAGASSCEGESCGVPRCWEPKVRLRPDMTRASRVHCSGAVSARLVTPPAHSDLSNVSADWYGLHFDGRPHDGAPRWDEAVFEVTGHEGSVELRVKIEVVPRSENSAPVCEGDRVAERSAGDAPVYLFMHPWCYDPDGDDFVMEGGPPGEHPYAPKKVPAGDSESNWPYITATHSGEETATVFATDSLGARSEPAKLEVTVGPGVDRLPACTPSSYSSADVIAVYARPGKIRRFGIVCTDPDSDPFAPLLTSPPTRGAMLPLVADAPQFGYWGMQQWVDTTYVPVGESLEPDPFTVTAHGLRGEGPAGRMAIVPREPPANGGGGCGYSPADAIAGLAAVLRVSCSDNDGDPFSVEIVTPPRHGTVTPGLVTPGRFGWDDITVPYVANPGYEGYDCVELRVTDGHGLVFKITIDIWVKLPVPDLPDLPELPELPDLPELPELPPLPEPPPVGDVPTLPTAPPAPGGVEGTDGPGGSEGTDGPGGPEGTPGTEEPGSPDGPGAPAGPGSAAPGSTTPGSAAPDSTTPGSAAPGSPTPGSPQDPGTPAGPGTPGSGSAPASPGALPGFAPPPEPPRSLAQRILETSAIKRVHSAGGVEVWARSKLSRKGLMRNGQAPGLVVVCTEECRIKGDAELANGTRAIRSSRRKTMAAVGSGQPHVLSLTLGPADRKALGRARKPRANFRLSVRPAGAKPTSLKRSIRFGK